MPFAPRAGRSSQQTFFSPRRGVHSLHVPALASRPAPHVHRSAAKFAHGRRSARTGQGRERRSCATTNRCCAGSGAAMPATTSIPATCCCISWPCRCSWPAPCWASMACCA
ncbi:protein of unknown function [Cupriavidus taiwanensis]|nr:protein of unknown function [Cupriavidus taiwanensis]